MALVDRLRSIVLPVLEDLGLQLYDFEYAGGVVRITLDHPDGVGLDAIAEVTRMVSREFDHSDPIEHAYSIEVSSPGLERTLRTPAHFTRALGSKVNVKLVAGTEGERRWVGTLTEASESSITLDVDGVPRSLALRDIERARTVFEWAGTPKPGARRPATPRVPVSAATEERQT